jgi:hypothetical protein
MFRLFFTLILFTTPCLAADWEGVFEGTLGKAKILVELNAWQDTSSFPSCCSDGSRYSYLPRNYDLKLALEKAGDRLEFTEATVPHYAIAELPEDSPDRTGRWSLKVMGDKAVGTWTARDGKKTLPIALKRLSLAPQAAVPQDGNRLVATYNLRWFKDIKISGAAKPVRFGKVTLAFERDSAFHLPMPVFTAMPDKTRMGKANELLRGYYTQSLMTNRDCINNLAHESNVPKEPEFNFEVVYASPTVVTISEGGSVFCGGAHPNNYATYLTFDLVKAKQIGGRYQVDLTPEGFGEALKLANRQERIAFEAFALARWQAAAKAAGESGDESCAGAGFMGEQPAGEKDFTLGFHPKGLLVFRTDYPSVAANCLFQDFNPTIIPWKEIKPYLREGQNLIITEMK